MRLLLTIGLTIATAVGVAGCNSGSKSGTRKSGAATVTSSNTPGPGTGTSADAPQITGVSPAGGPVDGGTAVIISGSNFTKTGAGQTLVLFGTRAVVVTPTNDNEIRVTSPLQTSPGPVDVRVVNELGVDTLAASFDYNPLTPGVSYSPVVGCGDPAGQGGTKITLKLVGFAPVTSNTTVDFGAAPAASVTIVDPSTLIAEVPTAATPGVVSITVTEGAQTVTAPGFRVQGMLTYGDLIINEVLLHPNSTDANNDGLGSSTQDEFIEIVNTTSNPIDLTFILLRDNLKTGQTPVICHRFQNPTSIPAGGSIVVFGGGMPTGFAPRHSSGSAQQSISADGTLLLVNTGEFMDIQDQHTATLTSPPTTVFRAELDPAIVGTSWTLKNEGQRLNTTATALDYEPHPARAVNPTTTFNHSAGTKRDGTSF
jgi:hypothetical protein